MPSKSMTWRWSCSQVDRIASKFRLSVMSHLAVSVLYSRSAVMPSSIESDFVCHLPTWPGPNDIRHAVRRVREPSVSTVAGGVSLLVVAERADAAREVRRVRRWVEAGAHARVARADADLRAAQPSPCREEVLADRRAAGAYVPHRRHEIRLTRRIGLRLERAEHDVVRVDLRVVVARHAVDLRVRAALFFVVVREAQRERVRRLPQDVGAKDRVVLRAEVPRRRSSPR